MRDAVRVRLGERLGDFAGRSARSSAADGRRPDRDFLAERGAVDEFGDDEQLVVDFLERVDGADARMRQAGGRPRLAPQPFALRRIARQVRRAAP